MVKLYTTSLLAVTLATGSALASSSDSERRSELNQAPITSHLRFGLACARHDSLQSRGLVDEEDLFVRDDAFDDLEAREPGKGFGGITSAYKVGKTIAKHDNTKKAFKALDYGSQILGAVQTVKQLGTRGFEDDEDILERDLDDSDDLEAREPKGGKFGAIGSAFKIGKSLFQHKHTKNAFKAFNYASQAGGYVQQFKQLAGRGFEDDEDILERDLDASDDIEAREPKKSRSIVLAYNIEKSLAQQHKHTKNAFKASNYALQDADYVQKFKQLDGRGFEDDEDIFERDLLDAEELVERDYDLLEERDTIDDLD